VCVRQDLGAAPSRTADSVTKTYIDAAIATTAKIANNLSDLASPTAARTSLGLGTAATMAGPSSALVGISDTQTLANKSIDGATNTLGNLPATALTGTVPLISIPGGIPQNSISGLVGSLASLLGTSTFQSLVDGIANALGHAGTGYTITQVEGYLGLIPAGNLTGTLTTGNIPGLPTSKITTGTFLSSFLPMFGLKQNAGTNLVLDPGFESTAMWTKQTTGSRSTAQAHGGVNSWMFTGNGVQQSLYMLQTDLSASANSVHTAAGEIFSLGAWVYPSSSNTGTSGTVAFWLQCSDSSGVTAPSTLTRSWSPAALTKGAWNYISTNFTVPAGLDTAAPVIVLASSITTGDVNYVDDLLVREQTLAQSVINSLFSTGTVGSQIQVSAIPSGIPQNSISGLVTSLAGLLGTTTFQTLLDNISNALGHAGTGHTVTDVETYLGVIPPANVAPALGRSSLSADLTALGNLFFGSPTVGSAVLPAALPNIAAGSGAGQSADLLSHLNNVAAQTGATAATPVSAAQTALTTQSNTLANVSATLQAQQTQSSGANNSGASFFVNFGQYATGPFSVTPFTVTYGNVPGAGSHGTGSLVIDSSHHAAWQAVNDGNVSVVGVYTPGYILSFTGTPTGGTFTLTYVNPNTGASATTSAIAYNATAATIQTALQALANMPSSGVTVVTTATGFTITLTTTGPLTTTSSVTGGTAVVTNYGYTDTDYQELKATLAGYPNGGNSKNFAILRSNAAGTDYVYGVIYLNTSFQLCWEVGCYVSGVQHVFSSGTNAPLNLSFTFRVGVGTEPYRFQGVSGNTVVFDYTDASHVSQLGSTHRYWGFRSDTFNNGQTSPAPAAYVGTADNQPPAIPGSGMLQYRSGGSTGSVLAGVSTVWYFPGGFFDTTLRNSTDILPNTLPTGVNGVVGCQVANAGRYVVTVRADIIFSASTGMVTVTPGVRRLNQAGTVLEERLGTGLGVAFNIVGAQDYTSHMGGNIPMVCAAGDYLLPYYYIDGIGTVSSLAFTGDASGAHTYWDVTLANWSFN
jgi:hypothetical protein